MTRRPLPFRQADVERAVKAALSAGLSIGAVEVTQSGTIRVITTNEVGATVPELAFDQWRASKDAGSA